MTREELVSAWKQRIGEAGGVMKIKHKNMKTVEFYPVSYEESVFHKFHGYWIVLQLNQPIISDTIKIRKEDLANWNIVEE